MTIREAMVAVEKLAFSVDVPAEKLHWLDRLDRRIKENILDTHVGLERVEFDGYDADTDLDTELLVGAPYDIIYPLWMEAQIHYANKDIDQYNAAILHFNEEFLAAESWYNRRYMPRGAGKRFLF